MRAQALTGIKEDEVEVGGVGGTHQGETFAVLSLIRLSSLLEKMPVLQPGGKEVSLIAESLQVGVGVNCGGGAGGGQGACADSLQVGVGVKRGGGQGACAESLEVGVGVKCGGGSAQGACAQSRVLLGLLWRCVGNGFVKTTRLSLKMPDQHPCSCELPAG